MISAFLQRVILGLLKYSEAFNRRDGCATAVLLCSSDTAHTASHSSRLRGRRDTRWAIMNLDRVLPIPLCYSDYVKTAIDLSMSRDVARIKLLKQAQNVCIVYSCLGVKRNGGTLSTQDKLREACKGFMEIAVPGFFKWAKDNNHEFPAWHLWRKWAARL